MTTSKPHAIRRASSVKLVIKSKLSHLHNLVDLTERRYIEVQW